MELTRLRVGVTMFFRLRFTPLITNSIPVKVSLILWIWPVLKEGVNWNRSTKIKTSSIDLKQITYERDRDAAQQDTRSKRRHRPTTTTLTKRPSNNQTELHEELTLKVITTETSRPCSQTCSRANPT